ncbi:hypothetical protein BZA05DRAFT_421190 [Tricharina praecox]|uniref:uncharacterized protein n=1 Tax=Tricharina praecox TaxID=43433 RepID=UPI00221F2751|nr:uncharacterized protein BZA05DRAFT_421190 [Tricharina praecox]KAI5845941.1 hypothetical protein BZA05DRAFT_421190 [Tricharina praecox]
MADPYRSHPIKYLEASKSYSPRIDGNPPTFASPSLATSPPKYIPHPTPPMCQYKLQIFACGDSYITREKPCANRYPLHCNTFEVPLETRHAIDCYPCRRNPKRRILPAMARGIYAHR